MSAVVFLAGPVLAVAAVVAAATDFGCRVAVPLVHSICNAACQMVVPTGRVQQTMLQVYRVPLTKHVSWHPATLDMS